MAQFIDIEDHAALREFLIESGRLSASDYFYARSVSGVLSCRAVFIEFPITGRAWVLKQAFPQRRGHNDVLSGGLRLEREALALQHLNALAPSGAVSSLVFEHRRENILAMQAVPSPHDNWEHLLLQGTVANDHVRQFGQILGTIHRESWRTRADLMLMFDDRTFFEMLRLAPDYDYPATQFDEAAPFLETLLEETRAARLAIVHGDFSPQNVLIHGGQMVLLNHETVHWGDPAFDAGVALAHLLSHAHHLPKHRLRFFEAARTFWKAYFAFVRAVSWARDLEARATRHALANLLAHAAGQKPLEYLHEDEKQSQQRAALLLMQNPPATLEQLIARLAEQIHQRHYVSISARGLPFDA